MCSCVVLKLYVSAHVRVSGLGGVGVCMRANMCYFKVLDLIQRLSVRLVEYHPSGSVLFHSELSFIAIYL